VVHLPFRLVRLRRTDIRPWVFVLERRRIFGRKSVPPSVGCLPGCGWQLRGCAEPPANGRGALGASARLGNAHLLLIGERFVALGNAPAKAPSPRHGTFRATRPSPSALLCRCCCMFCAGNALKGHGHDKTAPVSKDFWLPPPPRGGLGRGRCAPALEITPNPPRRGEGTGSIVSRCRATAIVVSLLLNLPPAIISLSGAALIRRRP
jgi:hypothetical protein